MCKGVLSWALPSNDKFQNCLFHVFNLNDLPLVSNLGKMECAKLALEKNVMFC